MTRDLYWISASPNSRRVLFSLEIKGMKYTSHHLDPGKQQHRTPEFMTMKPRGKADAAGGR